MDCANSQTLKFKMTCPECGAAVITASPEAMVWERCLSCRYHTWDFYDVLMAEVCGPDAHASCGRSVHAEN